MRLEFFFSRLAGVIGAVAALNGCAHQAVPGAAASRPVAFGRDTFAFANETVWSYQDGKVVSQAGAPGGDQTPGERYTRRCFVMSRAAVQFWKFARFDPKAPPADAGALARRVRDVTGRDVWGPPLPAAERVVIPGYANLHDFSARNPAPLRENIGLGWPTYFRPGNFGVVFPPGRDDEEEVYRGVSEMLRANLPAVLWLVNFPSLDINHSVVALREERSKDAAVFTVYDPNLPERPRQLRYDFASRTFSYPPAFYFKGGPVDVRWIYRSAWQ